MPRLIDMKSSPESRLKPIREIQLSNTARVVPSAGSDPKEPNTTSQAESLLASEKRQVEMMHNGASISEVLNVLCAAIDANAPRATSMVCLMDPDGKQLLPCAGPRIPDAF